MKSQQKITTLMLLISFMVFICVGYVGGANAIGASSKCSWVKVGSIRIEGAKSERSKVL